MRCRLCPRRPGYSKTRGKTQVADRRERARNSGIAGIEDACRSAGKHHRLRTRLKSRNLVVFFCPGRDAVPAQPVIQCQARPYVPTILSEQANIFVTRIERVELALVVLAGHADQEIRKIHAGFCTREDEAPVKLRDGMGIHLVGVTFTPELDCVAPSTFEKVSAA